MSSSRYFEAEVTIAIDSDERDVFVRGFVEVEPGLGMGGGLGAAIDGDPDVRLSDAWWPVDALNLDPGDLERIIEALEEKALEDDSDACVEHDDFDAREGA